MKRISLLLIGLFFLSFITSGCSVTSTGDTEYSRKYAKRKNSRVQTTLPARSERTRNTQGGLQNAACMVLYSAINKEEKRWF